MVNYKINKPKPGLDTDARLSLRFKKSIGVKLRNKRLSKNKTTLHIAFKIGISERHLRRIENGETDAGISVIGRLCAEYGTKPSDLFEGTEFSSPYVKD